MPSKRRPAPAHWGCDPVFSPESRAVTAKYPDFHLRVWCNVNGINVLAYVQWSDERGKLHTTDVARATWRGRPPSEEDVVLWGMMAASGWLEARVMAAGEAEVTGA